MLVARNLILSTLLLLAAAAWAQLGGDLQAQILYAYQAEDTNTLANLVQDLTTRVKADSGESALRYHLAHAQYRQGLLAAAGKPKLRSLRFLTVSISSNRCCRKMLSPWRP